MINPKSYIDQMLILERAMRHEIKQRTAEENRLLKRYELDQINLDEEYAKIQRKESYLSANKRALVVEIVEARKLNNEISNIIDFDLEMHEDKSSTAEVLAPQRTEHPAEETKGDKE